MVTKVYSLIWKILRTRLLEGACGSCIRCYDKGCKTVVLTRIFQISQLVSSMPSCVAPRQMPPVVRQSLSMHHATEVRVLRSKFPSLSRGWEK